MNARGREARVACREEGQEAETVFRRLARGPEASLLEAELLTGRTHQIRVHLAHLGHPVLGDDKYGDFELNKALRKQGLKRMFLHAARRSRSRTRSRASGCASRRRCPPTWSASRRDIAEEAAHERYELVVFDWDGTLMDSTRAHRVAACRVRAATSGIAVPERARMRCT